MGLHGADLRGATLRGVSFVEANLSQAVLRCADLEGCNFFRATFDQDSYCRFVEDLLTYIEVSATPGRAPSPSPNPSPRATPTKSEAFQPAVRRAKAQ